MRKNETVRNAIIALVCLAMAAYVLVGFGSAPATAPENKITDIGKTSLKVLDVYMAKERYRQFRNDQMGWSYVVGAVMDQAILLDGAKRTGLVVSDEELKDAVIANRTLNDGSFLDNEQWNNWIRRQYRLRVPTFEKYMRDNWMATDKFRGLFLDSAYVGEEEIVERFTEDNQKVNMELIVLNTYDVKGELDLADDTALQTFYSENTDEFKTGDQRRIQFVAFDVNEAVKDVELTDAELRQYYDANQARYVRQEQVKARHVLVKTDSRTDEEALARIQEAKKELDGGADFAEVATKYSEDEGSKARGGDLGLFQRGRMVKPFEDVAFSLEKDQISEPVKTQFGYHIIKKEDHQQGGLTPFDDVKESIRSAQGREKAKADLNNLAEAFRARVEGSGDFAGAASESSYDVHLSDPFDNDNRANLGEILNINYQVRTAAYALENLNDLTPVIDAGSRLVVAQWVEEVEPRTLDFEKDKNRIRTVAEQVAGRIFIAKEMDAIKAAAEQNPEQSLKEAAGDRGYLKDNHYQANVVATSRNIPWQIRKDDMDFADDLFTLEDGAFLPGYETSADTRLVLARVKTKEDADMVKLDEERFQIAETLRQERGSELLGSYIYARRQKIDPDGAKKVKLAAYFGDR